MIAGKKLSFADPLFRIVLANAVKIPEIRSVMCRPVALPDCLLSWRHGLLFFVFHG